MEMERKFGSEAACRQYLFEQRWPEGWRCVRCGNHRMRWIRRHMMRCTMCRHEMSPIVGTIFQDTHLPLQTWFRAMWHVTSQKTGVSALGMQRVLGLGSYKTAWAMLHKLRRAMVRPGREGLKGIIEVDETYWGSPETGVIGRLTHDKALIIVAAEADGDGIGRIRMKRIPDLTGANVRQFITRSIQTGSTIRTDGLRSYHGQDAYLHTPVVQHDPKKGTGLNRVHRVISLLKRWLMGTHQGAVGFEHLDYYLDEFTFRFNRRSSRSRGKLFYRLAQQAVQVEPAPFASLVRPLPIVGRGVK